MDGLLPAEVRSGWQAVLSLHVTWLVWTGLIKGLGVMLPALQKDFESSTWLVGWTIAIINGITDFAGPLAGPLEVLLGTRLVVMVSGVLIGGSLIASSLATSVTQLALSLTLLSGWIYDVSDSYNGAFILMGCIWCVSLLAMAAEVVMTRLGWITQQSFVQNF